MEGIYTTSVNQATLDEAPIGRINPLDDILGAIGELCGYHRSIKAHL